MQYLVQSHVDADLHVCYIAAVAPVQQLLREARRGAFADLSEVRRRAFAAALPPIKMISRKHALTSLHKTDVHRQIVPCGQRCRSRRSADQMPQRSFAASLSRDKCTSRQRPVVNQSVCQHSARGRSAAGQSVSRPVCQHSECRRRSAQSAVTFNEGGTRFSQIPQYAPLSL